MNNLQKSIFRVSILSRSIAYINKISSPKSEPTIELHGRGVPSVEAHHRVNGFNTLRNSEGRRKKNPALWFNYKLVLLISLACSTHWEQKDDSSKKGKFVVCNKGLMRMYDKDDLCFEIFPANLSCSLI